jgi:hypothetical protein
MGLLLLGKGAVLAHGFDRPLATPMDETEQRPSCRRLTRRDCSSAEGGTRSTLAETSASGDVTV